MDFLQSALLHNSVAAAIPTTQVLKCGKLSGQIRTIDSIADVRGQCPVPILGNHYSTLDIILLLGTLLWLFGCHVIMHVAVKLIKRDVAVSIEVGLTSL